MLTVEQIRSKAQTMRRMGAATIEAHQLEGMADEIEQLRSALHAAIARPAGVVPDVALKFYDPKHPALGPMAQV